MNKKKGSFQRLAVMALAAACAAGVLHTKASALYGTVDGGSINVRNGAGTEYDRLMVVETGTRVNVLWVENGWYYVELNGVYGYISGEYVIPDAEEPAVDVPVDVEPQWVEPQPEAAQWIEPQPPEYMYEYGYLTDAATVQPADVQPMEPPAPDDDDGVEDWDPRPGTVTGGTINVRTGPGTEYDRLTTVESGQPVVVFGEQNGWYHVAFNGIEGYILNEYLLEGDEAAEEDTAPPPPLAMAAGPGTVIGGTINVRSGPGVEYERLDVVSTGKQVTIVEQAGQWYHIAYEGVEGFILGDYLAEGANVLTTDRGVIYGGTINIRSGPGTNYDRITTSSTGQRVTILDRQGEWYHISFGGIEGYILGEYLAEGDSLPASALAEGSGVGAQVASLARQYLGVRYVYGGSSPSGFDCSGFTMYLYRQFGYSLPHSASSQYSCGRRVSRSELQPGDLVFFSASGHNGRITHVGVYIGNGEVIHARYSVGCISISSLSSSYYNNNYVGAVRIG